MDFLSPTKKRARAIKLIIGYVLIAIAIALVTLILVFQSYGYDLDRKTGSIIQNGLLFVASRPEAADVYLNGKLQKTQNDALLVLPSDIYKLELKRNGYRDWSRTISLAGGKIERYSYPFLFPTTLTSKEQKVYPAAPTLATASPDHKWILIQQPGQVGVFDQFDSGDSKKAPTVLTLPAGLLTTRGNSQLKVIEWSTDNRHLLVRHDFTGGNEFVVIDRETPTASYNVNRVFRVSLSQVEFRDDNFDQLYLYDQTSRKLDFGDQKNGTITPVLSDVLAFKSKGLDMITYATDVQAPAGKVRIMIKDKDGSYFLRELLTSPLYLLDLDQYSNQWYVAAGSSADKKAYIYKDPLDVIKPLGIKTAVPESVLRVDNPSWIDFSVSSQSVAIQGGSQFSVYDAENQRTYRYDLKVPLDAASPNASWMDGDRLIINSQGKMLVVDYDGTNLQTLSPNLPGLTPFFDRRFQLLYNLAPSVTTPNSYSLNRINLVVSQSL